MVLLEEFMTELVKDLVILWMPYQFDFWELSQRDLQVLSVIPKHRYWCAMDMEGLPFLHVTDVTAGLQVCQVSISQGSGISGSSGDWSFESRVCLAKVSVKLKHTALENRRLIHYVWCWIHFPEDLCPMLLCLGR